MDVTKFVVRNVSVKVHDHTVRKISVISCKTGFGRIKRRITTQTIHFKQLLKMSWSNIIENNCLLKSPFEGRWSQKNIQGSFFQEVRRGAQNHLEANPDWIFLNNVITGETLTVKEAFDLGDK